MPRILVVDDQPEMVALLVDLLEDEGFETVSALDGEAAIRAYHANRPDAVLLDFLMPTMDGLSTLIAILRIDPEARVAMLTGLATQAVVRESFEAGARDFVLKPFDLDRVLGAVEVLLAA